MEIIEDTTNFIASRLAFIIYRKQDTAQQGQQFRNGMRQKFDGLAQTDGNCWAEDETVLLHNLLEGIELRDEELDAYKSNLACVNVTHKSNKVWVNAFNKHLLQISDAFDLIFDAFEHC